MVRGVRGFTATELSWAYPGEKPGFAFAQGAFGENGLPREMRCVFTFTDTGAGAVNAKAANNPASTNAPETGLLPANPGPACFT
jgi:hypothetical protein